MLRFVAGIGGSKSTWYRYDFNIRRLCECNGGYGSIAHLAGKCGKCDSVFTTLYALGKLDNFAAVVDTEVVKAHLEGFIDDITVNVNGVYKGELYKFLEGKGMVTPKHRRIARIMKVASAEAAKKDVKEQKERNREST